MLANQQRKLKRMATLATILTKYGFKDALARIAPQSTTATEPSAAPKPADNSAHVRMRMVLEELGPTFVKLGQALSNREDILPPELIRELQNLQDHVELAQLDVDAVLADNFGPAYRDLLQELEPQALASASMAQVYKGVLKTGEKVVLKVKRPGIDETIESDLLLMKDLAKVLTAYFDFADHLSLEQAVGAFEKSLLNELSFVNERENIERFAHNFKGNPHIYVPKVHRALCNNKVLCMEFIAGAKITDKDFHLANQLDTNALVDKGLKLYLSQILEHGFFHADPHAGNIMVLSDGRIVFIDMGAMGQIYRADQELLEDVIINIIAKNVNQLIAILKKMAVRIEIKDEKKLHEDLSSILSMVNVSNLENLNIVVLINKFKDILFENRIIMPDYFTLLVRGLVLIESVGRTLNPEMNIITSVKPYVNQILQKRLSPQYLWDKGIVKLQELSQDIQNVPYELRNVLQQLNEGKLSFNSEVKDLRKTNATLKSGFQEVSLAIILGANLIATALILSLGAGLQDGRVPTLGVLGLVFSAILAVILFFKMMKR